jgi:hypothetical protein
MKIFNKVKVTIEYIDEYDEIKIFVYNQNEIELAEMQIGLITGNICESDLTD